MNKSKLEYKLNIHLRTKGNIYGYKKYLEFSNRNTLKLNC